MNVELTFPKYFPEYGDYRYYLGPVFKPPVSVRDVQRALSAAQRKHRTTDLLVRVNYGRMWTADELAELGRRLGPKTLMPLGDEDEAEHSEAADTAEPQAQEGQPEAGQLGQAEAGQASNPISPDEVEDDFTDLDKPEPAEDEPDNREGKRALAQLMRGLKAELKAEAEGKPENGEEDSEPSQEGAYHPAEHRLRSGWHADRSLVRQVRRLLQRWMSDGAHDDGPRVDWERGITRLLVGRDPRQVRREEVGTPRLAVLIDDSPSCGRFVTKAAPLAAALMHVGAADVVAVHTNGYYADLWARGKLVGETTDLSAAMPELRGTTHVLILGDWDAEPLYRKLAATREVIWLDGWRARVVGYPFDATERVIDQWGDRDAARVRYVAGCGEPEHWIEALELAISS